MLCKVHSAFRCKLVNCCKATSVHYSPFFAQLRAGELHLVQSSSAQSAHSGASGDSTVLVESMRQIEKEWAGGRKQGEGISQEQ